jgi:uncharacterized protein (TIGR02996 family)
MTTEEAFVAEICADPASDGVRLIFSDWLDENGQPERAEFIRIQCELDRICFGGWTPTLADKPVLEPLRRRERELLVLHGREWVGAALGSCADHVMWRPLERMFRRGFVARLECTLANWLEHGPEVVRRQPVEQVTLSDRRAERTWPGGRFLWHFTYGATPWQRPEAPEYSYLPAAFFPHLPGRGLDARFTSHASQEEAQTALSAACLAWARVPGQQMPRPPGLYFSSPS